MIPAEARELMLAVRANHGRLNGCLRHEFAPAPVKPGSVASRTPLVLRYRCAACGGEVDAHAHYWYQRGREHGGV